LISYLADIRYGIHNEIGFISQTTAAAIANELEQLAERHHGEVEQELRRLVGVLRQALDESDDHNGELT
jgi:hypothetical protein